MVLVAPTLLPLIHNLSDSIYLTGRPVPVTIPSYTNSFADGHERRLPRLVSGPFRFKTFAADYMARGLHLAQNLVKQVSAMLRLL
jgi:hypothetical protein